MRLPMHTSTLRRIAGSIMLAVPPALLMANPPATTYASDDVAAVYDKVLRDDEGERFATTMVSAAGRD
jgi:hypothetical protein